MQDSHRIGDRTLSWSRLVDHLRSCPVHSMRDLHAATGRCVQVRCDLPLQHDHLHARCCAYAARRLTADGWAVRLEVEVGTGRYRGWIDFLTTRISDASVLSIELKTQIVDVGAIQRTIAWYERESWSVARSQALRPRVVRSALLILRTAETDDRIRANADLLGMSFPSSGSVLAAWVAGIGPAPAGRSIGIIDPRTRGSTWIMPTTLDGRRSRPRYSDYRDAAGQLLER